MRAGAEVYLNANYDDLYVVRANDIDGDGTMRHAIELVDADGNVGTYPVITVEQSELELATTKIKTLVDEQATTIADMQADIATLEAAVATLQGQVTTLEAAVADLDGRIGDLEGP